MEQKTAAKTKEGLTLKQEEFCQMYINADRELFGNGTQCYYQVFNKRSKDGKDSLTYKSASVLASKELAKVRIIERINSLLETGGFTNENIDKQHLFLINQHADLRTKLGAIKEFNELKQRIIKKVDITTKGEKINPVSKEIADKAITDYLNEKKENNTSNNKERGTEGIEGIV